MKLPIDRCIGFEKMYNNKIINEEISIEGNLFLAYVKMGT